MKLSEYKKNVRKNALKIYELELEPRDAGIVTFWCNKYPDINYYTVVYDEKPETEYLTIACYTEKAIERVEWITDNI